MYDDWTFHRIPFDDPAALAAGERVGAIYFTDGYVQGRVEQAIRREDSFAPIGLFRDPLGCWMHHFASWAPAVHPRGVEYGVDIDAFPFPEIDESHTGLLLGGGETLLVFRDRPEVRRVVEKILSPEYGVEWAADPSLLPFEPSNVHFDLDAFADPVHRAQAAQVQQALQVDGFRFDASDLMPPEVGTGTFWSGMIDYLSSGPDSLERVFAEIEASWPDE